MADNRFRMVAYTGAVISSDFWGGVVFDIAGIRTPEKLPALREHGRDRSAGVIDRVWKEDGKLMASGFYLETPDGRECQSLIRQGFPMQASVGIWCSGVEQVKKGAVAVVNGRTIAGPVAVWREAMVREISFVSLGADSATSAIAASAGISGSDGNDFGSIVAEFEAKGHTRGQAVIAAQKKYPGLHQAWLSGLRAGTRQRRSTECESAFFSEVDRIMDVRGLSRGAAVSLVARQNPQLHQAMLNEIRGR